MIPHSLYYTCHRILSTCEIEVCIEPHNVGVYPMTYTAQECLEDFCDKAGWKFLSLGKGSGSGRFYFERPLGRDSMRAVRDISITYSRTLCGVVE